MSEKDFKKRICVVTVTYGKRFNLLKQVVSRVLEEGVYKVFIVNNAVSKDDCALIKKMQKDDPNRIGVIVKKQNIGSAGGYKSGIGIAIADKECEFVWLLDDDNVPEKGTLNKLIAQWKVIENKDKDKDKKIALLANRVDQPIYNDAIQSGDPKLFLTRNNNFLGFHFVDTIRVILKICFNARMRRNKRDVVESKTLEVAPYGGLFFHKDLIDVIGLPNQNFFVYADDFDFSYRITKNHGKIIFVSDALIRDIDESWQAKEIKNPIRRLLVGNPSKVYYYIRNRTFFEMRNLRTNRFVYNVNIFIIMFAFYIYTLFNKEDNFRVIRTAIKDGKNGRLGKNPSFNKI